MLEHKRASTSGRVTGIRRATTYKPVPAMQRFSLLISINKAQRKKALSKIQTNRSAWFQFPSAKEKGGGMNLTQSRKLKEEFL